MSDQNHEPIEEEFDVPSSLSVGTDFLDEEPEPEPEKSANPEPTDDLAILRQTVEIQKGLLEEMRKKPSAAPAAPAAPIPQAQPQNYTIEDLRKLAEEDPIQAMAFLAARAKDEAIRNLEGRIGSFASAGAVTAEAHARAQFPDVFEHYGDEVRELVQGLDPVQRADPQAWANVAKYVRGGHIDEIITRRTAEAEAKTKAEAQKAEADRVAAASRGGRTGRREAASAGGDKTYGLSAEQRRAAEVGGMTLEEYARVLNSMTRRGR